MAEAKISLKNYNTFGLDCFSNNLIYLSQETEIENIIKSIGNQPYMVLGGGSNVLFTQDFDGTIVLNCIKGIHKIKEDQKHVWVESGAGEVWHEFVIKCIENQWFGIENLSLIPGSVGASPIQNIGAYGIEIVDIMDSVSFFNLENHKFETLNNDQCNFGYRDSIFKNELKGKFIITKVIFKLLKTPQIKLEYGAIKDTLTEMGISNPRPKDVSDAVIKIRSSKLPNPKEIGNCGSFFKNPVISKELFNTIQSKYSSIPSYPADHNMVKIPAGWLIEQAGWKGKTIGNIGVHKNQALVLVNYGGGKGSEIKKLAFDIIADIKEKFNIDLHAEVNII